MEESYDKAIRPILDYYDKLAFLLKDKTVNIPKIVVVGAQSSGKSSVLESLSQIELPRGEGIVTRCPIMIQLRKAKESEYAMIGLQGESEERHQKIKLGEIAGKLSGIQKQVIENLGDKLLSKDSIQLKVFRNNAPDLTLIDLPGITHQNESDHKVIKEIIQQYIEGDETIILLILSATEDAAANEGISLIRQKDPEFGKRTIPVFSKIDWALSNSPTLLASNIDSASKLGCNFHPLMVRNRTQQEIENNEPYEKIREKEENLINDAAVLKPYAEKGKQGIRGLIKLLVQVQREKLLESKDKIKDVLRKEIIKNESELKKFPKQIETREDFNMILDKCCKDFNELLDIKFKNVEAYVGPNPTFEDCTQTKIRKELERHRTSFMKLSYKLFTKDYYERVDKYVKNIIGFNFRNFYTEKAIYNILEYEIKNMFIECEGLPDKVNGIIENDTRVVLEQAFKINSNLKEKAKEIYEELILHSNMIDCRKFYEHLKDIENNKKFTLNKAYDNLGEIIAEKILKTTNKNYGNDIWR